MAAARPDTSTTCTAREAGLLGPPMKKFTPRSAGPGSDGAGEPGTLYWVAVKPPSVDQPGTGTTLASFVAPGPASASPLTIRFGPPDGGGGGGSGVWAPSGVAQIQAKPWPPDSAFCAQVDGCESSTVYRPGGSVRSGSTSQTALRTPPWPVRPVACQGPYTRPSWSCSAIVPGVAPCA